MSADNFGIIPKTLRTFSGVQIVIDQPEPSQLNLSDIGHALGRITRFGGHINADHYSVAEHSCECLQLAKVLGYTGDAQKAVLLHDAPEAYLGDLIRPIKVELPKFYEYELIFEQAIKERFNVDLAQYADEIKFVDNVLLIAEKNRFMRRSQEFTFSNESKYKLADDCD